MQFGNIKEATQYVGKGLDSYFQETDYMEKGLILMDLFEIVVEKMADEKMTPAVAKLLETDGGNELAVDVVLVEHFPRYPLLLGEAVKEYLMQYIDVESTKVVG